MINKFQQGGKLQDAIMLFVQGLAQTLQADPNLVILIAQLNPDALKAAIQVYQQTLDMGQAAQVFLQSLQLKTQAAKHGAKLSYLKSLKHQCAEDEELVYYKKGGAVNCGCVKKNQDGGKTPDDAVAKFKAVRKAQPGSKITRIADATGSQGGFKKAIDSKKSTLKKKSETKEGWDKHGNYIVTKKGIEEKRKQLTSNKTEEETTPPNINKGIGKNCSGAKMKFQKKGGEVCPKCGKVHKAGIGCTVAKFKAYKLGGSLNGIPFMQSGTPKGGIEKPDNTRVNRIPNNGEGVYEQMPINGWDFVPVVGTYREAQRLDKEDPNASKLGFATSLGMDLLGAWMITPALKAAAKASRLSKLLKSRGFNKITEQGLYRSQPNIYMKVAPETTKYLYYNVTRPTVRFKLVPTVDVSGIALSPLVQTLRVPTQAMAH